LSGAHGGGAIPGAAVAVMAVGSVVVCLSAWRMCAEDFSQRTLGEAKPGPVILFQINLGFSNYFHYSNFENKIKHQLSEV
jgi:hypothetical protein